MISLQECMSAINDIQAFASFIVVFVLGAAIGFMFDLYRHREEKDR